MRLTQTSNKTLAVRLAVEDFVRQEQMRELANHMGSVKILSNDEIETLEHTGE